MASYSFLDANASIRGPMGFYQLGGPGSGNSEGGITITQTEDRNTMTIGAGGEGMHSLHAGKSGMVTVRLLKTSPQNNQMQTLFDLDTNSSRSHGQNTITIIDNARGDSIICEECAFARFSDITYAKDGGENTWTFHSVRITYILGKGIPVQIYPGTIAGGGTAGQTQVQLAQAQAQARARGLQSVRNAERSAMVERAMATAREAASPTAKNGSSGSRRALAQ